MNYRGSVLELIGGTPLLRLKKIENELKLNFELYAKLDYLNPAGSSKDRAALYMIKDAEDKGIIKEGATVIEATSGNTGIGLACVCAVRGYRAIIVMPGTMSAERIAFIKAYGAEVVLTDGSKGMTGAIEKANELNREIPNSFIPKQFENKAAARAHYETTGPEIFSSLDGNIDYFIAGIGCGGTVTGVGTYMKENCPECRIIGVEPASSPLLSEGRSGAHGIQGIGANFVPSVLDRSVVDEVLTAGDGESYDCARLVAKTEGFLCGISSGATLAACLKLKEKTDLEGKKVVLFFPDGGDRYLSTDLYK